MQTESCSSEQTIDKELLEKILQRLGFADYHSADFESLTRLYAAWCTNVPFDNARKILHVTAKNPATLPGDSADDYFRAWLKHGTGGTCWAGNGALCTLLSSLGFCASRGVATMLVTPNLPPNHGTVLVDVDGKTYWLDASTLHENPLLLDAEKASENLLRYKAKLRFEDNKWIIWWYPLHRPEGLDCRIDSYPASKADFQQYHEQTRGWSPFNYELNVRKLVDNKALGFGFGKWVELDCGGELQSREVQSNDERIRLLVDRLGYSEEIATQIPPDQPTPPPPKAST